MIILKQVFVAFSKVFSGNPEITKVLCSVRADLLFLPLPVQGAYV